jgi:large subunit ribosomal protein L4e
MGQRRFAVASAVAATGVPSLVMARGHRVAQVPELPLVLGGVQELGTTKAAYSVLQEFGVSQDVDKAKASTALRRGVGKMRNRRYVSRRGPLVVHADYKSKMNTAFRNLPGVDLCHVNDLNLLQLAPGGHVGRLVVWTQEAFEKLDALFGSGPGVEAALKKDFTLARPAMSTADVARIINSDEIQRVVRPAQQRAPKTMRKKNPLKNLGVMVKLNPYTLAARRAEIRLQEQRKELRAQKKLPKKVSGSTRQSRRKFVDNLLS